MSYLFSSELRLRGVHIPTTPTDATTTLSVSGLPTEACNATLCSFCCAPFSPLLLHYAPLYSLGALLKAAIPCSVNSRAPRLGQTWDTLFPNRERQSSILTSWYIQIHTYDLEINDSKPLSRCSTPDIRDLATTDSFARYVLTNEYRKEKN